jgi:hypothetical protein
MRANPLFEGARPSGAAEKFPGELFERAQLHRLLKNSLRWAIRVELALKASSAYVTPTKTVARIELPFQRGVLRCLFCFR